MPIKWINRPSRKHSKPVQRPTEQKPSESKSNASWAFDQIDIRDDVDLALKDSDWKLRVYKVLSGDSGEIYWIQWLHLGEREEGPGTDIILCDCLAHKFQHPLEVLGMGQEVRCKHIIRLLLAEGVK
jgi:hypothetical protein